MSLIELRDVWKIYDLGEVKVEALKAADLAIGQAEYVSLMGPSGSGKSTLMNLVGCLDRPTRGSYRLAGDAKENIEALSRRQKRRLIAQMPFSKNAGRVAGWLEHFGDRYLVRMKPLGVERTQDSATVAAHVNIDAPRIAARHQSRPARRADAAGDIKARELCPLGRQPIDMRRAVQLGTEAADIAVAEIINKEDNKIRRPLGRE